MLVCLHGDGGIHHTSVCIEGGDRRQLKQNNLCCSWTCCSISLHTPVLLLTVHPSPSALSIGGDAARVHLSCVSFTHWCVWPQTLSWIRLRYPVTITTVGFLSKNRTRREVYHHSTEGQTTPITQKCTSFSSEQHKGITSIQYHLSHVYRVFANKMSSVWAFRQEGPNPDWFGRNESKLPSENKSVKGKRTTAAARLGLRFVELVCRMRRTRCRCCLCSGYVAVQASLGGWCSFSLELRVPITTGFTVSFSFPTKINIHVIFIVAKAKQLHAVA